MSALDTRPETVALIGLGPSYYDFISAAGCKKNFIEPDEVWGVNSTLDVFRLDKCFVMDDLRVVAKRFPQWSSKIAQTKTPVITCNAYEEFPSSIAYPLQEVFQTIQDDFFTTTVAYMVAYAIHIQVKEMYIFGMDFWYPKSMAKEPGADAVCYLLGIAKAKGINFKIPQSSTLMDANMTRVDENGRASRLLYGYDYNPGDAKQRIEQGRGSDIDQLVAEKAPYAVSKTDGGGNAVHNEGA